MLCRVHFARLVHTAGDIGDEDVVHAVAGFVQHVTGSQGKLEIAVFVAPVGSDQVKTGLRAFQLIGDDQVTVEAAVASFQARRKVMRVVTAEGDSIAMARTFHARHGN